MVRRKIEEKVLSLALARKYRPATFDDLIGQESVSQTLSLALDGERLSHAYLFSGLRGSGKTSTARIFAKALLCEKGASSHPCGTCSHCLMAAQGNHMDIIEMDAASNRGIDDIKDLIEHTKYKPSAARYKIFIIDEVHMLTNQAFNALLKTLEEPPDFVKFILATTDPLKLPATILSRTQHFRFKKIPQNLVLKHLEHILNLEGIGYEEEALTIIARSGAGSMRDALTLLDQAIVYSKNFVDLSTVTKMLGIIEPSLLTQLLQDIYAKDTSKILDFIHLASEYEAEMILDELTLHIKALLLAQDREFTPMIIERFFRVLADAKHLLSLGSDGEFVLTLTLFKMVESLQIKDIESMIRGLEQELKGIEVPHVSTPTPPPTSTPKEESVVEEPEAPKQEPQEEAPTTNQVEKSTQPSPQEPTPTPPAKEEPTPQHPTLEEKKFQTLQEKIFDRNYDLGVIFESNITFVSFEEATLTWESTAQDEEKKQLITHWGLINMFVKEVFGFETKIKNIAKEKKEVVAPKEEVPPTPPQEETPPPHSDANNSSMIEELEMKSSCVAPEAGETEAAKEKDPSTLLQEPMVKEAIALFNPKKVRIKRNM